jgi:hypothetical protein
MNDVEYKKLIDTIKEIELLIEDNNQNIKDCNKILLMIKSKIMEDKIPLYKKPINWVMRKIKI